MKSRTRLLGWVLMLATLLFLGINLGELKSQERAIRTEGERIAREKVRLQSALAVAARLHEKRFAPSVSAPADATPLTADARRERDLFTEIDRIAPIEDLVPKQPFPSGRHGNVLFSELMDTPGYSARLRDIFRVQTETRYGSWFHRLNVSPDVRARMGELLIEEQHFTELEAEETAVRAGLDLDRDRSQVMRLKGELRDKLHMEMRSLLGESGYADFVAYDNSVIGRESLAPLEKRLSYSEEPLTDEQITRINEVVSPTTLAMNQKTNVDVLLAPAKALFSTKQWEVVEEYAREKAALTSR